MKPEHLLDAMEYISADYIAEAKPHTEQHNESRVEQQAKSAAETVTLKQSQQKSQRSGKDITMSNRSFGQRIMTGVIAAAACAVFVGGGIFIAMQAKQNRPETANSGNENSEIEEITDRNFLGGQGEIHIMQNMEIMYDDINYYFGCGHYAAPRSSESLTEMHEVSAEQSDFLTHVLTDGEQFYYTDEACDAIYRMDKSGRREEKPLFSISGYTDWTNVGITSIDRLGDDEYVIWASGDVGYRGCRFNAATKEADAMPDGALPLGLYRESDDSILYRSGDYNEISRYTFSTKESVPVTAGIRGRVNGEWIVRNNRLYLVSTSTENPDENGKYGKIDLATGEFSAIKYGFYSFTTDGDKIFGLVNDDRELVCTDPEWTSPETLYDFSTAEIPERFRDEMNFKIPFCADENYVCITVDARSDCMRELLFDRKSGKMLYFYLPVSDQSAQETDGSNLFGGTGLIHPACRNSDSHSTCCFLCDDAYYYLLIGAQWYRFALDGGSGEPLPDRVNGAALPDQAFLTDGENVLTNNLVPVNGGASYPDINFTPVTGGEMYPSIEEIRGMLNPETHSAEDFINPVSIHRVGDKYFMFLRTENPEKLETRAENPEDAGTYKVFLWLDKNGNLLDISEEKDPLEEFGGCFTDVENEHVYYWRNSIGDVQHPGQSVTIRELPAPGQTADYQAPTDCAGFCCISGGKTLYLNANGALCGMEDGRQSIICEGLGRIAGSIVLHDQLYYIARAANYYDTSDSDRLMILNVGADSPQPVTSYESEQKNEVTLLGWTGSGNRNEIALMESGAHRILFIEPKSKTITGELKIPADENASESYADLEMVAENITHAFIDYMTNKDEATFENLGVLDQYLSKDSSAYQKLHSMVTDVSWNTPYDSRVEKELTVSNIRINGDTCTCDVHFDYELTLTGGNMQNYSNDMRWEFVKEDGFWKAFDFSYIPSENQTVSGLNIEGLSDVSGSTFRGKLLKIKDPARVTLGVSGQYGDAYEGRLVKDMAAENGAFAAINAGTFMDLNGVGNGGTPLGIVIAKSKLLWGDLNETTDVVGFDQDNRLRAGSMTGKQAMELGLRDAVSCSPVLIADGKALEQDASLSNSPNPRTAIGQTADGTVLLLVIEGRQADSLGATYNDIIDIMLKNGAVTAANLGGGSQSHMICSNQMVTASSSLYGPRKLPNCWLVAPES